MDGWIDQSTNQSTLFGHVTLLSLTKARYKNVPASTMDNDYFADSYLTRKSKM